MQSNVFESVDLDGGLTNPSGLIRNKLRDNIEKQSYFYQFQNQAALHQISAFPSIENSLALMVDAKPSQEEATEPKVITCQIASDIQDKNDIFADLAKPQERSIVFSSENHLSYDENLES